MHANNETGAMQPICARSPRSRAQRGVLLHSDGVQAAGRLPVDVQDLGVDLYSLVGAQDERAEGRRGAFRARENGR